MALNWSKQSRRKQGPDEAVMALARLVSLPEDCPSKEELRAVARVAVATVRRPIRKLPTILDLRCPCGHRKRVAIAPDRARPRFKCSRCGTRI